MACFVIGGGLPLEMSLGRVLITGHWAFALGTDRTLVMAGMTWMTHSDIAQGRPRHRINGSFCGRKAVDTTKAFRFTVIIMCCR